MSSKEEWYRLFEWLQTTDLTPSDVRKVCENHQRKMLEVTQPGFRMPPRDPADE